MEQKTLVKPSSKTDIGSGISLEIRGSKNGIAIQYDYGVEIKRVDLSDKTAKRIFIVDLVERGVNQTKLADKLKISRQSIRNYVQRKRLFGLEGLMNVTVQPPLIFFTQQEEEEVHPAPDAEP